jgi:hypothetical protein
MRGRTVFDKPKLWIAEFGSPAPLHVLTQRSIDSVWYPSLDIVWLLNQATTSASSRRVRRPALSAVAPLSGRGRWARLI